MKPQYIKQRPYASKVAGTPISSEFDLDALNYTFSFIPFTSDETTKLQEEGYSVSDKFASVTEIFVPYFHFGGKPLNIQTNVGECDYDEEKQTLYHHYNRKEESIDSVTISIGVVNNEVKSGSPCMIM